MKKLFTFLIVATLFLSVTETYAQEETYGGVLNAFVKFGDNSSISANYEFQIAQDITLSPEARIWFGNDSQISIGARADYYFDRIFKLVEPWDIWGGVDAGFIIDGDDSLSLNIHAGAEYKFNETWGLILEVGGGTTAAGGIGVGIHF